MTSGFNTVSQPLLSSAVRPRPESERAHDMSGSSFAALVRQSARSADGQRISPARFDETGLFDARAVPSHEPRAVGTDAGPGWRGAKLTAEPDLAPPPATPDAVTSADAVSRRDFGARTNEQPTLQQEAKVANARADGAAAVMERKTPERSVTTRTRVAAPKADTHSHTSTVFVALRPTQTSFAVFARPGRMAPTDQAKLRNAIGSLLAEFGHHDAAIELGDTAGETSWRK